jgi:hypothetical protein
VGDVDIYESFSFVEVPARAADRVLRALNRTTIRGRPVQATIARPVEEGSWRDDERRAARPPRASALPRRIPFGPRRGAGRPPTGRPPSVRPYTGRRDRKGR